MFSGKFYVSYQVFIAVPRLEVPFYAEKRDSLDLEKFRPGRRAVVLRLVCELMEVRHVLFQTLR